MNGDRLNELEAGFLNGSLGDAEENELKAWVMDQPEHELYPYFALAAQSDDLDMPDFKARIVLDQPKGIPWLKVAAAVIVLCVVGFLFKDSILPARQKAYSETEIDESYKATMETLSAMAGFLDKSLTDAEQAIDLSKPFEKLNDLKDENSK